MMSSYPALQHITIRVLEPYTVPKNCKAYVENISTRCDAANNEHEYIDILYLTTTKSNYAERP